MEMNYGTFNGCWASQVALVVENPPANAEDVRDAGSVPGSGRSPGGGHGNPLQSSCLENPMVRAAWRATVHRVAKSWTQLKRLSRHSHVRISLKKKNNSNSPFPVVLDAKALCTGGEGRFQVYSTPLGSLAALLLRGCECSQF